MTNYVYIIAGLPDFTPDWRLGEKALDECLAQMRELLSEKDNSVVSFITGGFDKEKIGIEFYKEAVASPAYVEPEHLYVADTTTTMHARGIHMRLDSDDDAS
jgi:hypothetical protein